MLLDQNVTVDHFMVLFQYLSEDKNIVQVYNYDSFRYEVIENIIYYSLEGGYIISYIKEYYQNFKKSTIQNAIFYLSLGLIWILLKF